MFVMNVLKSFLSTEVTCLPRILDAYVGKYYNNALTNGIFWMFWLWVLIHVVFEYNVNKVLRRMKYPEYYRVRILKTVWNLSFSVCSLLYCAATFIKYDIDPFKVYSTYNISDGASVPGYLVPGFVILTTYYIHIALWEALSVGLDFPFFNYFFLGVFAVFTYYVKWVELMYGLFSVISFINLSYEVTKCAWFLIKLYSFFEYLTWFLFGFYLVLSFVSHLIVIPMHFIIPAVNSLYWTRYPTVFMLNLTLWCLMVVDIRISPVMKVLQHWVCHGTEDISECSGTFFECILFMPRSDTAYAMKRIRKEIEKRNEELANLQRKPLQKAGLVQTLKCMITVKRHLKRKRMIKANQKRQALLAEADKIDDSLHPTT